ncbi:MAG: TIM barrel protein [Candidatus Woesearchaeota archaeon]
MPKMDRLRFGTAGIPIRAHGLKTHDGISEVRKLGLEAMELEFVHSVNLNSQTAKLANESRLKNDVVLTTHGSYYINLNAQEKEKLAASISRILQAAYIARQAGSWSLTFHPAYYLKDDPKIVYDRAYDALKKITTELKENENKIWIRPETTGKATQFGNLKEIIKLSQELDNLMPCVDFAHLHARNGGGNNSLTEFRATLTEIEKGLGKEGLENMHIHMSGINYGDKGEKNHLILKESDFKYEELMQSFKEFKLKGVVICESPNIEEDALLMQKEYGR